LSFVAAEGLTLLSVGLLLSTRLSGITAGVIALVAWLIAWIAGVVGDIGTGLQHGPLENVGVVRHLILPSDGLWLGAIYAMAPAIKTTFDIPSTTRASITPALHATQLNP